MLKPDQILVGHVYQGGAGDFDKTREVTAIEGVLVHTRVRRGTTDLGDSALTLRTMALWAAKDVTDQPSAGGT